MNRPGRYESTPAACWIFALTLMGSLIHGASHAQDVETVYRIIIASGVSDEQARDFKLVYESADFVPIYIIPGGAGRFSVHYGNFGSRREALTMRDELSKQGYDTEGIVEATRGGGGEAQFTVVVDKLDTEARAQETKAALDGRGHIGVKVDQVGAFWWVSVGSFPTREKAGNVLAAVKDEGFTSASVEEIVESTGPGAATPAPATGGAMLTAEEVGALSQADPALAGLTPQQLEKLAEIIGRQQGGASDSAMMDELVSLRRDLNKLGIEFDDVKGKVEKVLSEREEEARKRVLVARMIKEINNLVKAKRYEEALIKVREALAIDDNNPILIQRERVIDGIIKGEDPDEGRDTTVEYEKKKELAEQQERLGSFPAYSSARNTWIDIKELDESRYGAEADRRIADLDQKIAQLSSATQGESPTLLLAIVGGVVVLLIGLVAFFIFRTSKKQKEMISKIQEATAVKPMRGMAGGGRRESDWMLVAPGMGNDPQGAGTQPGGAPAAAPGGGMDDLFDDSPESPAADDVFAAPPPQAPAPRAAAAPPPPPAAAPPPSPPPAPAPGGIPSLDDILSGGSSPAAPSAPSPQAGSVFDEIDKAAAPAPTPAPPPPAPKPAAPAALSLDEILGTGSSGAATHPPPPAPAAKKGPLADPLAGLGLSGDDTVIETPGKPGGAPPLPSLDLGSPAAAAPAGAQANGTLYLETFEGDAVGQPPSKWTGNYPYATLTIAADEPAAGSTKYLVYKKDEGAGKVYYSSRFPNTDGIFSVEFDLKCDNKNKFLLGFYIEKDEDFQKAIHTKILRSESQTAPSIHIHGQPAPYLLGTWAHIKYEINLKEGKVDGYVDGRHIAKGVNLPTVPEYLNTFAIRDNINTTGVLAIDNLKVTRP